MCFRCNECGLAMCSSDHDPWPKVGIITSMNQYNISIGAIIDWTEENQKEGGDALYLSYYKDKKSNEAQWIAQLCASCLCRRSKL
jgi:hypothetical protein